MTKETYQFKVSFLCVWSVHSRYKEKKKKLEAGRAVQAEGTPTICQGETSNPCMFGIPITCFEKLYLPEILCRFRQNDLKMYRFCWH